MALELNNVEAGKGYWGQTLKLTFSKSPATSPIPTSSLSNYNALKAFEK